MANQFDLTEDQLAIKDMARKFTADRITTFAREWDEKSHYPVERFWRDLRVRSILEGTNQVMRMIVGKDLLRQ